MIGFTTSRPNWQHCITSSCDRGKHTLSHFGAFSPLDLTGRSRLPPEVLRHCLPALATARKRQQAAPACPTAPRPPSESERQANSGDIHSSRDTGVPGQLPREASSECARSQLQHTLLWRAVECGAQYRTAIHSTGNGAHKARRLARVKGWAASPATHDRNKETVGQPLAGAESSSGGLLRRHQIGNIGSPHHCGPFICPPLGRASVGRKERRRNQLAPPLKAPATLCRQPCGAVAGGPPRAGLLRQALCHLWASVNRPRVWGPCPF